MGKFARLLGGNLLRVALLLIAVSVVTFALMSLSPVDPVQAYVGAGVSVSPEQRANIAAYWGLDKPPVQRFLAWGSALLRGDFGTSLTYRAPVLEVIGQRAGASFALMGTAWLLSGLIGLGLGIAMGACRGGWLDRVLKAVCLAMASTPAFWLGLVLLSAFSVALGWFPIGLSAPPGVLAGEVTLAQRLHHMALPALTLSLTSFANIALHTREKLAAALDSDYALYARARGESRWSVVRRHGLRNVLIPALTLQFASFSELFGGSVLAEQVFSYPGLGQAAVQAGLRSDLPLLMGITLFSALFVFCGNAVANLLYGAVDPRIREGGWE